MQKKDDMITKLKEKYEGNLFQGPEVTKVDKK